MLKVPSKQSLHSSIALNTMWIEIGVASGEDVGVEVMEVPNFSFPPLQANTCLRFYRVRCTFVIDPDESDEIPRGWDSSHRLHSPEKAVLWSRILKRGHLDAYNSGIGINVGFFRTESSIDLHGGVCSLRPDHVQVYLAGSNKENHVGPV